jgi:hypothetical protein
MSSKASQRRDQRRRLVVSWNRSAAATGPTASTEPRSMAEYSREAHPEHQPSPAVLLPTGLGGMALAIAAILVPVAGAVAVAVWEPLVGRDLFTSSGRFGGTLRAVKACFDPGTMQSLAGWLTQMLLVLAAAVALVVRLMRRHRRDDYNGRFRAWGWLAGLFVITSCCAAVPVGHVVGTAIVDASGVPLGPDGLGWWVVMAAVAYGAVSLWAVLPLHERGATSFWLLLALSAWGGSAACTWLAAGRDRLLIAAHASWMAGAALAAIAMLAAARSVIREVRGQCRVPAANRARPGSAEEGDDADQQEPEIADSDASDAAQATDASEESDAGEPDFTAADEEPEQRHLSKAERKRLKKLARMNRAA